jgi:hypothetical protein
VTDSVGWSKVRVVSDSALKRSINPSPSLCRRSTVQQVRYAEGKVVVVASGAGVHTKFPTCRTMFMGPSL